MSLYLKNILNVIMIDDYDHTNDSAIMYITDSIPGRAKCDAENQVINDDFNSQLMLQCDCQDKCDDGCACLLSSCGKNYIYNNDNITLNFDKIGEGQSYPVFECSSLCKCSNSCGNRLVQYGPASGLIIKDCQDQMNSSKGKGLFTEDLKAKGTFICTYAGEVITKKEALIRHNKNQLSEAMNYIFCLKEYSDGQVTETIIDPSKFGNIGRYINHSCEPNCIIVPVRVDCPVVKLAIFSCTNIIAGSEITFDYGSCGMTENFMNVDKMKRKRCLCGSKLCRLWMPFEMY